MTAPTTAPPTLDPAFRSTFRAASSSVWVVTTAAGGRPVGFTAISVVSVSVDPLLVSFNVSRTSSSLPALLEARRLAVHLLAGDQEPVARRFAGTAAHRFAAEGSWSWGPDGLPDLDGVVSRLSGEVVSVVDAGDSVVVIARVATATTRDGVPLTHRDRTYAPAREALR